MDVFTIIGYILFALSELFSLLPINTNGFLDTLRVGLRNSISDSNGNPDIEMAQNILRSKPEIAKLINDISTNPKLTSTVNRLTGNLHVVQFVNTLIKNQDVQFIFTLLKNNPGIIHDVKGLVVSHLNKQPNLPQEIPQIQQPLPQEIPQDLDLQQLQNQIENMV